jgi:uncharacterized protein YidB (DUF937 family)
VRRHAGGTTGATFTNTVSRRRIVGILDSIAHQVLGGGSAQGKLTEAVMGILGKQQAGGLAGLVQQLAGKGLSEIVNSWVSTGNNLPITPQQVQHGLGSSTISHIASQAGISPEAATSQLAILLPQIVDKLTPDGKLPEGDIIQQGLSLLKGLKL